MPYTSQYFYQSKWYIGSLRSFNLKKDSCAEPSVQPKLHEIYEHLITICMDCKVYFRQSRSLKSVYQVKLFIVNKSEDRIFPNQQRMLPLSTKSIIFNIGPPASAANLNVFTYLKYVRKNNLFHKVCSAFFIPRQSRNS